MTALGTVIQVGRSMFLGVSHVPHPNGAGLQSPIFWDPYLRPNGLTYSDEIWYGNVRELRVSRGQPHLRPKGWVPASPIFGTSYMRAQYVKRRPNFAW